MTQKTRFFFLCTAVYAAIMTSATLGMNKKNIIKHDEYKKFITEEKTPLSYWEFIKRVVTPTDLPELGLTVINEFKTTLKEIKQTAKRKIIQLRKPKYN
ncbi:hypothetical protein KAH94_01500 [bacterium]|nr:hypothetical protein [bacterium]